MATKEYELVANEYHETTSKPGEPFTYKTHRKGDTVKLDAEQAERLLEAGAVQEKGQRSRTRSGKPGKGEPGGDTVAPKGDAADAVDAPEGGPDPQGTGSTVPGDGGGPADGQGAASKTASSRAKS